MTGRSACDRCGYRLSPRDLVPLLSYMILRGRCRKCGTAIGWEQPVAELACALLGILAALLTDDWVSLILMLVFGWQLILLAILDLRHFWLPPGAIALFGVSAIAVTISGGMEGETMVPLVLSQLAGGALGFALLAAPAIAYRYFRGEEGMGAADPPILAAIGLWMGPVGVVFVLFLSATVGLIAAIAGRVLGLFVDGKTPVPLGTLLAVSAIALRLVGVGS